MSSSAGTGSSSSTNCGNNRVNAGEACDGTDLAGETCLSRGYREALAVGLRCATDCLSFDVSTCGEPITQFDSVRSAVLDAKARPGHDVISIQPGSYSWNQTLYLECVGCSTSDGVTLRPLAGAVTITCDDPDCIVIRAGNNIIEGFEFRDGKTTVSFDSYNATSGNNIFRHNAVVSSTSTADTVFDVKSNGNRFESNFIRVTTSANHVFRITGADDTRLEMNVVQARADNSVSLENGAQRTFINNNTFLHAQRGSIAKAAISAQGASGLCVHNNIVVNVQASYPMTLGLEMQNVSFGTSDSCGGVVNGRNSTTGFATQCSGGSCVSACASGPWCDVTDAPAASLLTDPSACLSPADPLVDRGIDIGLDMVDDSDLRFLGAAPELGARESGSTRTYGFTSSTCP